MPKPTYLAGTAVVVLLAAGAFLAGESYLIPHQIEARLQSDGFTAASVEAAPWSGTVTISQLARHQDKIDLKAGKVTLHTGAWALIAAPFGGLEGKPIDATVESIQLAINASVIQVPSLTIDSLVAGAGDDLLSRIASFSAAKITIPSATAKASTPNQGDLTYQVQDTEIGSIAGGRIASATVGHVAETINNAKVMSLSATVSDENAQDIDLIGIINLWNGTLPAGSPPVVIEKAFRVGGGEGEVTLANQTTPARFSFGPITGSDFTLGSPGFALRDMANGDSSQAMKHAAALELAAGFSSMDYGPIRVEGAAFQFSLDQTHLGTFQAADISLLQLSGFALTTPQTNVKFSRFALENLDLSGMFRSMAAGVIKPSPAMIPGLGAIDVQNLTVQVPSFGTVGTQHFRLALSDFIGTIPTATSITLSHLTTPVPDSFRAKPTNGWLPEKLDIDAALDAKWQPQSSTLAISHVAASEPSLGSVAGSVSFGGVTPLVVASKNTSTVTLKALSFRAEDWGIVSRVGAFLAPGAPQKQMIAALNAAFQASIKNDKNPEKFDFAAQAAVPQIIANPGQMALSVVVQTPPELALPQAGNANWQFTVSKR